MTKFDPIKYMNQQLRGLIIAMLFAIMLELLIIIFDKQIRMLVDQYIN